MYTLPSITYLEVGENTEELLAVVILVGDRVLTEAQVADSQSLLYAFSY